MDNPLFIIVSTLLSGGFLGAVISLYTARKKAPAERDSIIVAGAETAVVTLEKALASETRRAERAESEVRKRDDIIARKDQRIEALENRLDVLQKMLDEARVELRAIITPPN